MPKAKGRKVKIRYHSIQSDHAFAIPEFSHSEIVEYTNEADLRKHIESKKDKYDYHYKKCCGEKIVGFDYISFAGGVKVEPYKPPKVKKI